jgi:hypothetical protein
MIKLTSDNIKLLSLYNKYLMVCGGRVRKVTDNVIQYLNDPQMKIPIQSYLLVIYLLDNSLFKNNSFRKGEHVKVTIFEMKSFEIEVDKD